MHISRLYNGRWTIEVVSASNALGVDLIAVTGDLIDGSITDRVRDIDALGDLRATAGVYVIPRNHEYFFDSEAWMQHFVSLGMVPLANSHIVIERREAQVVLAGVTDITAAETGLPPPDLPYALAGAPGHAPVILLDHQPRSARRGGVMPASYDCRSRLESCHHGIEVHGQLRHLVAGF
nr:hypothetical protein [Pseudomonas coleopterorum]